MLVRRDRFRAKSPVGDCSYERPPTFAPLSKEAFAHTRKAHLAVIHSFQKASPMTWMSFTRYPIAKVLSSTAEALPTTSPLSWSDGAIWEVAKMIWWSAGSDSLSLTTSSWRW